jgi:hypothetical protein
MLVSPAYSNVLRGHDAQPLNVYFILRLIVVCGIANQACHVIGRQSKLGNMQVDES